MWKCFYVPSCYWWWSPSLSPQGHSSMASDLGDVSANFLLILKTEHKWETCFQTIHIQPQMSEDTYTFNSPQSDHFHQTHWICLDALLKSPPLQVISTVNDNSQFLLHSITILWSADYTCDMIGLIRDWHHTIAIAAGNLTRQQFPQHNAVEKQSLSRVMRPLAQGMDDHLRGRGIQLNLQQRKLSSLRHCYACWYYLVWLLFSYVNTDICFPCL